MPEVERTSNSGESAAQFIEFVMMQAQNASLFLGLTPNPNTGRPEVNLELARMFIDHLSMIQEKTRGNLSGEESSVLRNYLSQLQMAFYQVSQQRGGVAPAPAPGRPAAAPERTPAGGTKPEPRRPAPAPAPAAPAPAPPPPAAAEEEGREKKVRFSKSYGS